MVTSFDIKMQSFYKLQQVKGEHVPIFITRFEGDLNHIRMEHLRCLGEHEAQGHLCDHLFYALKNLKDSLHYLYDNPHVDYIQLMVATIKAKSESEDS